MELIHGGDWAGYQREYGRLPLDFSASLSPLGLPGRVREAVIRSLDTAACYPDPLCRELREKLSHVYGVPAAQIVCGAGAAELIHRLVQALRPRRALVTAPGFAEYSRALAAAGCETQRCLLRREEGFALTERILEQIVPGLELLFLCNPDNPSGQLIDPALLAAILARCARTGTLLVLDECFLELTAAPEAHSLLDRLAENPRLLILRAFTKTYAMAGLRLGYALCGSEELARRLQDFGQPWAASSVAQAAGLAALEERDYVQHARRLIAAQRPRLAARLASLGLEVIPGAANYLLFRSEDPTLWEKLRERGILLRSCANFEGLDAHWLRTAIRTAEENDRLLSALREVLSDG